MDLALKRPATERLLVNKGELAKLLGCSKPTVDSMIDRYAEFPIVERGSNGIEWQFDAEAVIEFLRETKRSEQRAADERRELFSQIEMPGLDDEAEAGPISASQRLALAKALQLERKMAREEGLLMSVAELRPVLTRVLAQLGKSLDTLPGQLGRQFSLPDEIVRALRRAIADYRRNAVRELRDFLAEADALAD